MERLLADATALTGVKYDISNLSDVYSAIHAVQEEMGVTGTTSKEAMETVSGSIGMAKASLQDFLGGLGNSNADVKQLAKNMIESFKVVVKNIRGVLSTIWDNIPLKGWQKNILAFGVAVGPLLLLVGKLTTGVGGLIFKFGQFAGVVKKLGLIKAIFSPGVIVVGIILALIAAGILLYKNWDAIKAKVNEVFPNAQQTISTSIEHIINIFWGLSRVLSIVMLPVQLAFFTAWEIIKNIFIVAVETIGGVISGLLQALSGIIDFVVNVFTGNWAGAWQAVQDIFGGIFKGLVALAKAPLNLIIGLINGVIGGLNKIKLPKWVPKIGGKGVNIPLIPKLAKGTSNWQGGIVQVQFKYISC